MFKDFHLSELLRNGVAKLYSEFDVTDFRLPLPAFALMLMAVNYCEVPERFVLFVSFFPDSSLFLLSHSFRHPSCCVFTVGTCFLPALWHIHLVNSCLAACLRHAVMCIYKKHCFPPSNRLCGSLSFIYTTEIILTRTEALKGVRNNGSLKVTQQDYQCTICCYVQLPR